jgi:hypothetical protein
LTIPDACQELCNDAAPVKILYLTVNDMTTKATLNLKGGIYEGEIMINPSNPAHPIRHGKGAMNFTDGTKYNGEWVADCFDGNGEFCWPDGRKFNGRYKNNKMHGLGEVTWPDGRAYLGEYKMDKIHGHGVVTLLDGRGFEGEFQDDYPVEGQAVESSGETFRVTFNGSTYVSEWKHVTKKLIGRFETGWRGADSRRSLREFVWNDGRRFAGSCNGFCPLVGALTDVNGNQFAVLYGGSTLFSEDPIPISKIKLKTQVMLRDVHILNLLVCQNVH